jgi:hypothetical protein
MPIIALSNANPRLAGEFYGGITVGASFMFVAETLEGAVDGLTVWFGDSAVWTEKKRVLRKDNTLFYVYGTVRQEFQFRDGSGSWATHPILLLNGLFVEEHYE